MMTILFDREHNIKDHIRFNVFPRTECIQDVQRKCIFCTEIPMRIISNLNERRYANIFVVFETTVFSAETIQIPHYNYSLDKKHMRRTNKSVNLFPLKIFCIKDIRVRCYFIQPCIWCRWTWQRNIMRTKNNKYPCLSMCITLHNEILEING